LTLTPRDARALDAIDLDGLVETLCELITYESYGGHEEAVQRRMAELLRDAGMATDVWDLDLDRLRQHPAYGAEIERDRALGVTGRWGRDEGPSLILNGHVDVVPAGDLDRWSVSPWRGTVRDGRVYGRGAADMKGGLCCALYAVRALRAAGVELAGSVVIQSVVGEEDGGVGTLAAIERGPTADAAIVLEPTALAVAPAQAGALSFRITVPGRAAHGALRTEGVNPLDHVGGINAALRDLERRRNARLQHRLFSSYEIPFAISIGKVAAGAWASSVPERLVLEGRYGIGIGEDSREAERAFEAAIAAAARDDAWLREHPPVVEWWGARFEPAAIPADHPLVSVLSGAVEAVSGEPPPIRGMPYGADMRLLVREGRTPTVLFGPGDIRRAHVPDEYVPIADLVAATRALVLTVLRFCAPSRGGARF
jgi:acetylornithine deacetylase